VKTITKTMKSKKHKSISVFLTSLVIVTLILMGPANAISINISNPNDATQGEKVNFEIVVDLESPDMYLPIAYTNLIFTKPNDEQFECKVYNDGSTDCENIEAIVTFDLTYGQGNQFGYGYGYDSNNGYGYENTYFGYGYGYGYAGEDGKITYNITLNLENNSEIGEYKVKAETYVITEDSADDNQGFAYCDTMLGMYREYYYLVGGNGLNHTIDLNNDSIVNLEDFVLFATNPSNDSEMFGRFSEYFRFIYENGSINQNLDVFPENGGDGVINLSDLVIFAQYYNSEGSEAWCAAQISLIEGVERKYISNTQNFNVEELAIIVDPVTPNGGNDDTGGSGGVYCADGYIKDPNAKACIKVEEELITNNETNETSEDGFSSADLSPEENRGFFAPITGAVTGVLGNTGSILLLIILLIGLGTFIFYRAKKRKLKQ
jgi:hypothetical protein